MSAWIFIPYDEPRVIDKDGTAINGIRLDLTTGSIKELKWIAGILCAKGIEAKVKTDEREEDHRRS